MYFALLFRDSYGNSESLFSFSQKTMAYAKITDKQCHCLPRAHQHHDKNIITFFLSGDNTQFNISVVRVEDDKQLNNHIERYTQLK